MSFQTTWKNTWLLYWESTWFSSIVSDSRAQVLTDKQVIFLMKHSNTYQKFSKMINLNLWKRTVFIHRITWTVSKFDERLPEKKIFSTTFFKMKIYLMSNTIMLKICETHSILIQWVNIMICIWSQIFSCLPIYSITSKRPVYNITNLIHVIIFHLQDSLGTLC